MTVATQYDEIFNKISKAKHLAATKGREQALPLTREIANNLPDHVGVLVEFSDLASMMEEHTIAIGALVKARDLDPENAETLAALGAMLLNNRQFEAAEEQLIQAISLKPNLWTALRDLGMIYASRNMFLEAIPFLEQAIKLKPSMPEMYANMAVCLVRVQRYEEALEYAEKALKLNPDNPNVYDTIGSALVELGELDEAESYFLKAIKLHRLFGTAYSNLTQAKKFTDKDLPFIRKTEALLKESMPAKDRKSLHFALSKMYDDLKEWKKAFSHAQKANLLEESSREENPPPKKFFKSMQAVYTPEFFAQHQDIGNPSTIPVFIVGMPRSGTSLTEQIISSHPLAAGAGELGDIHKLANTITEPVDPKLYRAQIEKLCNAQDIEEISGRYLKTLTTERETAQKITDKMPENYFYLGLIMLLFPNAKIIHVKRNPLDTCLSCYFQPFPFLDWTFTPEWIGNRYASYRKIMEFWHKVLPPDSIMDLQYEDLIASPEETARQLIDFCDLEWDPVCLEFYKTKRAVNTASVWQVRQPLYKSSVRRWRDYGPAIRDLALPLIKYLDQEDLDALKEMGIKVKKGLFF